MLSNEPETTDSYLALPNNANGAGILLLHAWWGLTPFFRSLCDRLAQEGFVVLAPDLYHGATANTIKEAENLSSTLQSDIVIREIQQAAVTLRSHELVQKSLIGAVGFSLGGYWSLWMAQQADCGIGATVVFYGASGDDYTKSTSAFQFHLAENDDYEPQIYVDQTRESLSAAGKEAEFFVYPNTKHWFFEPEAPNAYNEEAAQLAWERTLTFLHSHL